MAADAPAQDPHSTYEERLAARLATAALAAAQVERVSNLRLAVFALLVGLLIAIGGWDLTAHTLWLPLGAFALLVLRHGKAAAVERRAREAARLYENGLSRLDGTWAGQGLSGEGLAPAGHPYAADLDLFGAGGVFELLCVAKTRVGERRLADWLLTPATPEAVRLRQDAVRELTPQLDEREALALTEGHVRSALERASALPWAKAPLRLRSKGRLWIHRLLAATSTVLLIGWLGFAWKPLWMVLSMLVQFVMATLDRPAVHEVLEAVDRPAQDLALIARILERLETTQPSSEHLRAQVARLVAGGPPPSERIRTLVRLMDLVDARLNQIFLPISWLGSLGTQWAYAIEDWREAHGAYLEGWLEVVAEVEALSSLANYAFEHPADTFPEIVDPEIVEAPTLEVTGLGHPLLADERNVRNDVHLALAQPAPQALLISGSNMSGKSTLLRSIGVATVMAFAGAPVRARSLRISPLAVGASIQLHDSLQEGASRFYAEIERLSQIVTLSREQAPALFLIDEVLHGTNSHDRRLGAAAVVHALLGAGALGLVTTHDLAIAGIADEDGSRVTNMHFEDQVEDGKIAFDYTLRPGVVTRGNALALMRMVGIDVPEDVAQEDVSDGAEPAGT